MPVKALFPQGSACVELAFSSGGPRVLRVDAVGGPPHCDFADEGAGWSSGCSPDWRSVTLAGVILDMLGEVGDELGSLCQVGAPDGMAVKCFWNIGEPGERTWVGKDECWKA